MPILTRPGLLRMFTKKKTLVEKAKAKTIEKTSSTHSSHHEEVEQVGNLPSQATLLRSQLDRNANSGEGKLGRPPPELADTNNHTARLRRFRESTVLSEPTQQYELINEVGEGSYGKVFKAMHKLTRHYYAIKVIPIPPDQDLSELNKEITALKLVHNSPYVVGYHGSFQHDDHIWIVMDLCEAGSMSDVISMCARDLSEDEIREVVTSALLGLSHLHAHHIIHRDIKAGNILLTNDGRAKLADFGVSAQITTLQARRDTLIGTPYWMAPEVIMEKKYDCRCDIWSLGITLIEMAEGAPPLDHIHPMRAIFQIPKRDPPKLNNESKWSPEMISFLAACLVKDPEQRSTAAQLLTHPWIASRAELMLAAEGVSPVIRILSAECGPIVAKHYAERAAQNLEDEAGGDTLKVVPKKNHPIAPAKTKKTEVVTRKSLTFLETSMHGVQDHDGDEDGNSLDRGSPRVELEALEEVPDFMKYFQREQEEEDDEAATPPAS